MIDESKYFVAEFVLYDLNRTVNEEIGREVHDFHKLVENQEENVGISYKNVSIFSYQDSEIQLMEHLMNKS